MQGGIQCGARFSQRMEMELVRQLGGGVGGKCSVSLGRASSNVPSNWFATWFITQGPSSASCHPVNSAFLQFLSQFSHGCRSGRLVSSLAFKHGSGISGERFQPFVEQFGTSRVASAPRVTTSFHPYDERVERRTDELVCPGCGIQMQDTNPKAPGFSKQPAPRKELVEKSELAKQMAELEKQQLEEQEQQSKEDEFWHEGIEDDYSGLAERSSSRRRAKKEKSSEEDVEKPVVCARCHALKNCCKVKDETVHTPSLISTICTPMIRKEEVEYRCSKSFLGCIQKFLSLSFGIYSSVA